MLLETSKPEALNTSTYAAPVLPIPLQALRSRSLKPYKALQPSGPPSGPPNTRNPSSPPGQDADAGRGAGDGKTSFFGAFQRLGVGFLYEALSDVGRLGFRVVRVFWVATTSEVSSCKMGAHEGSWPCMCCNHSHLSKSRQLRKHPSPYLPKFAEAPKPKPGSR